MNIQYLKEANRYGVKSLGSTSVTMNGKNLRSIPEFIFNMPNLKILNLTDNYIETVPDKIGKLKNLEELMLASNRITSLPSSIGSLTKLKIFYLHTNELTTLPATIGKLESLDKLMVSSNKLSSLPPAMFDAPKLNVLDLGNNKLTSIPEAISNLKKLNYLFLSDNQLTSLPKSIGDITSLVSVQLENNRLTRLPESIGNLENLHSLILNGNPLVSIPESMGKLPKKINIKYNQKWFNLREFLSAFKPKVVRTNALKITNKTNVINAGVMPASLSSVAPNKRAFINLKSNITNNGTLRRVYNINGLMGYMRGRKTGWLHGAKFTSNNVKLLQNVPFTVNKSAYLRNVRNTLTNTSVNNMVGAIAALKNRLPTNINKNDVNLMAKNAARSKVKNATNNTRNRVIKALRNKGLLTNEDVKKFGN
jgi:Leucine-rich repeat (LRR) protein|tara:strand:- start:1549 stop:2814 length:1266 start_codon:yes stop_codon:yes gene_type:complete